MTTYYRPRQAFAAQGPDGRVHSFGPDPVPASLVREGHWVLKGREELFDEFDLDVAFDAATPVEQATAAPGEKRTAARRKPTTKGD